MEKVYRLASVSQGSARVLFGAGRGLTAFVGRERELEKLETALEKKGSQTLVVDVVGDPGIGKSRLIAEFLKMFEGRRMRILKGQYSAQRARAPLSAFVDLVREVFRLNPADERAQMAAKLKEGLGAVGLGSPEAVALMMNMLGVAPFDDTLAGLDGVLIGLRTRTLLRDLIWSRARLTPTILVAEDLHWADNVSLELLQSLVETQEPCQLILMTTRRPEFDLPWRGRRDLLRLELSALSNRDVVRIACERLHVAELPKDIAGTILARAEGNPLFAEEISAYIVQRRRELLDEAAPSLALAAASLPQSLQSLLASRVDQASAAERMALQIASVIGRSFDPDVVVDIAARDDVSASMFGRLLTSGLLVVDDARGEMAFKHALLRDAVYDTLLSEQKVKLHRAVGELLEARGANHLNEIADELSLHFRVGQAPQKAFAYLFMAAQKNLSVYAVLEAEACLREALAIRVAANAAPSDLAPVVVRLLETLLLQSNYREASLVAAEFMPIVRACGDGRDFVLAAYYQALSLVQSLQPREAHTVICEAVEVARAIGDDRAQAYALGALLQCRTRLGLDAFEAAQSLKAEVMRAAGRCNDNFIRNASYFFVIWDYFYRGLFREARALAFELIASGESRGDPRASGFANWILGWIDLADGALDAAVERANECMRVAIAPFDRLQGEIIRALADVLGDRPAEGLVKIEGLNREFTRLGALYNVLEGPRGAALISLGRVSEGVAVLNDAIRRREEIGDRTMAGFSQILLAEIYIRILRRERKAPLAVLLKNLGFIIDTALFGRRHARALLDAARANPQFHPRGVAMARIEFNLGLLTGLKGDRRGAAEKFKEASLIALEQANEKLQARVAVASAELLGGDARAAP